MTDDDLRDHFAGLALIGVISVLGNDVFLHTGQESAQSAYEYADAMIAEREQRRNARERERALRRAEERARIEDAQRGPRP